MQLSPLLLFAFACATACYSPPEPGLCANDGDCTRNPGGQCWMSPAGRDVCVYPDSECSNGWRWDDLNQLSNACVHESDLPDVDAGSDASPDGDGGPPARWGLLVANARTVNTNPVEPLRLYAPGAGDNYASAWMSEELDWGRALAWGDFDGDGDQDFVVGNGFADRGRNRIYRNDGAASFSVFWTSVGVAYTPDVGWADVDGDTDLDMLAIVNSGVFLYRQTNGVFEPGVNATPSSGGAGSFDTADFDGDGDVDIATGGVPGSSIYLNDGSGSFTRMTWDGPANASTVALGDYDHDGDPDLAIGLSRGFFLYKNDGGAPVPAFNSSEIGITDYSSEVAWLDFDGDGDLDLAAAHCVSSATGCTPAPNRVYRNAGGTFSVAWAAPEQDISNSVAVADYNNDGKPDLAFGNLGTPTRLYKNVGGGTFSLVWSSPLSENTNAVAWAPL